MEKIFRTEVVAYMQRCLWPQMSSEHILVTSRKKPVAWVVSSRTSLDTGLRVPLLRKVARDGTLWRGVQPWGSWEGFGEVKELASVFLCLFCFGSFFPEREVSYWTMPFRVVICTSMARDNVKSSTAGMPGPPSGHYLLFINILQSSNAFS